MYMNILYKQTFKTLPVLCTYIKTYNIYTPMTSKTQEQNQTNYNKNIQKQNTKHNRG